MKTSGGTVNTVLKNGISTITFSHPKSNSLPGDLLRKMAEEITLMGNHPDAWVIILQSEGDKTFCGGASFDELVAIKNFEEGKRFFSGFAQVINAMRTVPKFILARVHARTVGGGVGLAAAADYAMAVEGASIRLSELALGIGPFVVGPPVERKIGTSAFMALTINPTEWKSAQWAREKGLYSEVYEDIPKLDAALQSLASKLAQSSHDAMAELKRVMWKGTEHWDTLLDERAAISGRLALSDFTKKSVARLKSQR
ncbi:MAG: enoyl-CoA hydratase/isomerase family protein [Bacteroidetes bacterium]|nr:enoyl-CoA hydratase/isomerase family protein [Bacteroidota bacterium]